METKVVIEAKDLIDALNRSVDALQCSRTEDLVTAMKKAIYELVEGNQKDGDWEHARRAQFELECALKWHEESGIRKEEKIVEKTISSLLR